MIENNEANDKGLIIMPHTIATTNITPVIVRRTKEFFKVIEYYY
jgi:hypothetical protein